MEMLDLFSLLFILNDEVIAKVKSDGIDPNFILIEALNDEGEVVSACQFGLSVSDEEDTLRVFSFCASFSDHVTCDQQAVNPVRFRGFLSFNSFYVF